MSHYELKPKEDGVRVDVGYDPWLDFYFFQLRRKMPGEGYKLVDWIGDGVVQRVNHAPCIPEIILNEAAKYSEIPDGLLELLISDRNPEPLLLESDPVIYAGMIEGEVWRHRPGTDPDEGLRIVGPQAKCFARSRQIAFAILRDFTGNEVRAKRLVPFFATSVLSELLAAPRKWLLTEVDVKHAIRDIEAENGLHWIVDAQCYVGDAKTTKLRSNDQLRRSARAGNHRQWGQVPVTT